MSVLVKFTIHKKTRNSTHTRLDLWVLAIASNKEKSDYKTVFFPVTSAFQHFSVLCLRSQVNILRKYEVNSTDRKSKGWQVAEQCLALSRAILQLTATSAGVFFC